MLSWRVQVGRFCWTEEEEGMGAKQACFVAFKGAFEGYLVEGKVWLRL
jgi:hypothetical protein